MGLTIVYSYKLKASPDEARRIVGSLHNFAKTLPFDRVTDVLEFDPPDGRYQFARPDAAHRAWKPGNEYLRRRRADGAEETVVVPSLHAMSFVAHVRGAETAEFGLASHPPVVVHHEDVITQRRGRGEQRRVGAGPAVEFQTRLRGWYSWSQGCKTQYAANPAYGGVENFLRAHLSIFQMVDECRRLGLKVRVRDDGKYWRHGDRDKLLAELARWDELIAGFAGKLSDHLGGSGGAVVAPIKERPDFEHLEARGDQLLRARGRSGGRASGKQRRRKG